MNDYQMYLEGELEARQMEIKMTKKYALFMNCRSYKCRMTPFFDTVEEVEKWIKQTKRFKTLELENSYIRPVMNWQEVIDNRNSYNCDNAVPKGE